MIIDQWGFYDPGYFPEDEMTLDVMTLHKSLVMNDLNMTLNGPNLVIFKKRG